MRSIKALRLRAYAEEFKYALSGSVVVGPFGVGGDLPLVVVLRTVEFKNRDMLAGGVGEDKTEESLRSQFPSYILHFTAKSDMRKRSAAMQQASSVKVISRM